MNKWAYVENNQVLEVYGDLPKNWRNISNFYVLNETELKFFSWYPVQINTPSLSANQEYGETTYVFDSENSVVIQSTAIIDIDVNALFQQQRTAFMDQLRNIRTDLLGKSDWTQLADVSAVLSENVQLQYRTYRQKLRDLPELYSHPPYDTETNISNVVWPDPTDSV